MTELKPFRGDRDKLPPLGFREGALVIDRAYRRIQIVLEYCVQHLRITRSEFGQDTGQLYCEVVDRVAAFVSS